jgi:uncharacterized protein (TIGR03066 family)
MPRLYSLALALLSTAGPAVADKKAEPPGKAEQLVGQWVPGKDNPDLPKGSTVQFHKNGKLTITVIEPKLGPIPINGKYKLTGDKLELTTEDANGESSTSAVKVKVLTAKRLVWIDEKGKGEFELVRK